MKKITLMAIALLFTATTAQAAPNSACIDRVNTEVKNAVTLFPGVNPKTVHVTFMRAKPSSLSAMEGEAQTPGYKVYSAVSFTQKKETVRWLNESGVVFDGDDTCSVLYTNLDVAG